MTENEKKELIVIVENEIDKLTHKIEELKEFTAPIAPDDAVGRISRMDAINNRSVYEASMRNVQGRLDQLIQMKKMINNPDFGLCSNCRQSIPFERLKLRPEIRLCANCIKR